MRLRRRQFLRGAGGAALALPWLESIGFGQAAIAPSRLVVVMHPHGTVPDRWTPSGTESDFAFSEILAPLEPHRGRLLILSGIDNQVRAEQRAGNGHNPAGRSLLTCMPFSGSVNLDGTVKPAGAQVENGPAAGPSFEQLIAARQVGARLDRLDLKVPDLGTGENQCFFAARDVPIEAQGDPEAVFRQLFGGAQAQAPAAPSTPRERLLRHRASILDAVTGDLEALRRRLPAGDRARLEAHAERVRELETRARLATALQFNDRCAPPIQDLGGNYSPYSESLLPTTTAAMIDLIAMSLACDVTRVVTLQFAEYHDPRFSFLGLNLPRPPYPNWHEMIHSGMGDAAVASDLTTGFRYYMSELARLLAALEAVPEGNGTLLDSTLVLAISEFGNGGGHSTRALPVVLAGNVSGQLRTGRHLPQMGRTTGDLYVTLLNLFGSSDTSFGLARGLDGSALVTGPLSGLT